MIRWFKGIFWWGFWLVARVMDHGGDSWMYHLKDLYIFDMR